MDAKERNQKQVKTLRAMSRKEWLSLPDSIKVFIPWDEARVSKVIELPSPAEVDAAVEYFTRQVSQ